MVYLLFIGIGVVYLSVNPIISVLFFIMSLYHLFSWMERRKQAFSRTMYLLLFLVLIGNAIYAFTMLGMVYISIGFLSLIFALSTWLSYQQRKIDEREDHEE